MRLPLLIAALVLPLGACHGGTAEDGPSIAGNGTGNARTFPVTGFTKIELAGADEVDVRVGTGFSVRAEGAEDELEKLRITRDGDALGIGRKRGFGLSGGKGLKLFVTMPAIRGVQIAGSGRMTIDRVEGQSFTGESAGAGKLEIGALDTESADFSTAGSGDMTLAGTTRSLDIDIAGAGSIKAQRLVASEAKVSIAGAGDVTATVNGPASVEIMGSGNVDLGAGASCTVNKMGSGEVRCAK
ncbi:head GIN domain-containing protein [Sphingomonas aracearum]|uniref:DUF2807 domain-containing protein n=1 Tax=Sphingomonas aracearum TaxID=2283317 RepID=A0A369VRQ6_9SPHN|nr:head GIN domain-containing protein [Sphingomonas aracearum]RDE04713.1 DUF2807 domain-containing protein [Sphingomonas aracearum]